MRELKGESRNSKMVAISLYRGNLHRVPDLPRRWLMPNPKISLKDFKTLLTRRSKALNSLRSTTAAAAAELNPHSDAKPQREPSKGDDSVLEVKLEPQNVVLREDGPSGELQYRKGSDGVDGGGGDCLASPVDRSNSLLVSKPNLLGNSSEVKCDVGASLQDGKGARLENPNLEVSFKVDVLLNDKEERKREVEDKLKVLNARKHSLVQVLKQILHVEEELKRRNSMQGMTIRQSDPLPVDPTIDNGSLISEIGPRLSVDANLGGDIERTDADDRINRNFPSCNILRTSSMSPPSSDSPLRKPAYIQNNTVSHPARASLWPAGSPSRFAPTGAGQQGPAAHLPSGGPTVSISGTNYVASSPSPAASGGTSVFRDARQSSPWN